MCAPKAPKPPAAKPDKHARLLLSRRQFDDLMIDAPTSNGARPIRREVQPVAPGAPTAAGLHISR